MPFALSQATQDTSLEYPQEKNVQLYLQSENIFPDGLHIPSYLRNLLNTFMTERGKLQTLQGLQFNLETSFIWFPLIPISTLEEYKWD